jgi:hypothetical protein
MPGWQLEKADYSGIFYDKPLNAAAVFRGCA